MQRQGAGLGHAPGGDKAFDSVACRPIPPNPRTQWPPKQWPPEEDEIGKHELSEHVDWMSYSHQQLYEMVHNGLDLGSAVQVAADWGKLGDDLDEIGHDLRKALDDSAEGWQGVAAGTAQEKLRGLADWSKDSGSRGKDVSVCVTRQADLAETARNNMPNPKPQLTPHPIPQDPMPVVNGGGGGLLQPMTSSAFVDSGFSGAGNMYRDCWGDLDRDRQAKQEAAQVMTKLQHDSLEVYRDVPRFASPDERADVLRTPRDPEPDPEPDPRDPGVPGDDSTSTSSTGGGATAGTPAGGGSARMAAPTGGLAAGGAPAYGASDQLSAGGRSGVGSFPSSGAAGVGSAPAASGGAGRGAVGGMPMGAAGAGSRQGGDTEHKLADYLEDDDDFFRAHTPVIPPVIGEDPPDRGGR